MNWTRPPPEHSTLVSVVLCFVVVPAAVETLSRGRSLGKLAAGLRIVRDDGGAIRFRHAVIRALIGFLEIYLTFGGLPSPSPSSTANPAGWATSLPALIRCGGAVPRGTRDRPLCLRGTCAPGQDRGHRPDAGRRGAAGRPVHPPGRHGCRRMSRGGMAAALATEFRVRGAVAAARNHA